MVFQKWWKFWFQIALFFTTQIMSLPSLILNGSWQAECIHLLVIWFHLTIGVSVMQWLNNKWTVSPFLPGFSTQPHFSILKQSEKRNVFRMYNWHVIYILLPSLWCSYFSESSHVLQYTNVSGRSNRKKSQLG